MNPPKSEIESWLVRLSTKYNLSLHLLKEYQRLFQDNGIPIPRRRKKSRSAERIVMVSTHGYWGDPPPAGVPDTGGQTYYVLEVSKAWARQGRKVIILARWFKPCPRVEQFAKNVWLVRIKDGGDKFIRKEDIYPLVPELAEASTAISALFGAHAVMGHYADGMAGAVEVGERLGIPVINIPHSMGIRKVKTLGFDPADPETWFDPQYNFWTRESFELTALKGANLEIANTPAEPVVLKDYYNAEFPHLIMPAGAGKDFFDAYKSRAKPEILKEYGLTPKKYLIFFGRFSEAKNIPGVVSVLGEARRLDPQLFKNMKLVIVGGEPGSPQKEEQIVEKQVKDMMGRYDLTKSEVIRIPSLDWQILSLLTRNSLFYVGMQMMEPFGMSVAEALAAGTPVMISKVAGITKWLKQDEEAIIVDPADPKSAAKKLAQAVRDKNVLKRLSVNGRRRAKDKFSWAGIAKLQGILLDQLYQGTSPQVMNAKKSFDEIFSRRENRAYHRLAFIWRGDPPIIRPQHKKAARGLIPHIRKEVERARKLGKRVIVAVGGESGAGKSEIAEYLRFALRREKIWGVTVPGDAFFKLTPAENHRARERAYQEGRLEEYLGPQEVDLPRLDSILDLASRTKTKTICLPSDCRRLQSRRYEDVPLDIALADVILVDLTYSLLLKNAGLKVFLESDYKKRIEEIRERNLARDPDQDFTFILTVLEIEHNIIQKMREEADLFITKDYDVKPSITI